MKFKYLSSDFLATYNEIIEELEEKQAEIDSIFSEKIENLVLRERDRLNHLVPEVFSAGQEVLISGSSKKGVVVGSKIEFNVATDEIDTFGKPLYGPGKYYSISSPRDEEVVTCEGFLRVYEVETEPSEIESDWGVSKISKGYYEDELEKK